MGWQWFFDDIGRNSATEKQQQQGSMDGAETFKVISSRQELELDYYARFEDTDSDFDPDMGDDFKVGIRINCVQPKMQSTMTDQCKK